VKKIIKADKDLDMMTAEAVFMVSVATVSLRPVHRHERKGP
jgi:hypothetical protein